MQYDYSQAFNDNLNGSITDLTCKGQIQQKKRTPKVRFCLRLLLVDN